MKSILLIGLGRFGKHIALHLNHLGHQVMAVDTSEERVEAVLPIVTNAQIGDSTNADFLESLGIRNYDVCIVAIGNNFQSSLETTSLLSELGANWMKIMPCLRFPFPKIGRTIRLESLIFVKNSTLTLWESRKAASWIYLFLQTLC